MLIQAKPSVFVEKMWGLVPQPVKEDYRTALADILKLKGEDWESGKHEIEAHWFATFEKGKHITWQQWLILYSLEKGLKGEASLKLSIASGHGIGKSAVVSWIILWFLFSFYNAQVPCTAPTGYQMYDVLWKELNLWIARMPKDVQTKYVWGADHIRMAESPATWFARAQTASKENTEALAGVHADHVLTVADEASGVPEQVYNTAEGAWTSGNIIVILISNPTRVNGYFYDTHHKLKRHWQCMRFSSIDSPVVDSGYEAKIAERHGRESAEYGIRVLGKFPKEDSMDDGGYVSLLTEKNINDIPDVGIRWTGAVILGVDPSGEGKDKTSWVLRDNFKMMKIHEERKSNAKTIAEKTITFIEQYGIDPRDVVVDSFGVGMDVGMQIAIATGGKMEVTTVNVGEKSDLESDQELYLNKRAEAYYKMKKWLQSEGEMVENKNFREELLEQKYKRGLSGKIQMMPKVDMKKKYGYDSPNDADAASLTFLRELSPAQTEEEREEAIAEQSIFDKFDVL